MESAADSLDHASQRKADKSGDWSSFTNFCANEFNGTCRWNMLRLASPDMRRTEGAEPDADKNQR